EYAPHDAQIAAAAEPFLVEGAVERARQLVKKAEGHVAMADYETAADLIQEAVEAAPRDGPTMLTAGKLSVRLGLDRQAMKYAQRATEVLPESVPACKLLLALSEAAGSWHSGARAAARLLALNP